MKAKYIALVFIVSNALVIDAQAVAIRGAPSCGEWVQEIQRNGNGMPNMSSTFWILGYLSGKAVTTGKEAVKNTDSASINAWISNYCRAKPLDHAADAGDELFKELVKRQGL